MKQLLFICMLFLAFYSTAQDEKDTTKMSVHKLDSLLGIQKKDRSDRNKDEDKWTNFYGLPEDQYRVILKKQFDAVINSSGKNTIGNYASADITDGELAFNATKNFKNGNILSFNTNGGVTDGIFAIFNETELNSNIGADLKFNWLLRKGSKIGYDEGEPEQLFASLERISQQYRFKNTIFDRQSVLLSEQDTLIQKKILEKTTQLINTNLTPLQRAELEYQLAELRLAQDSVRLKLLLFEPKEDNTTANSKLKKKATLDAIEAFEFTTMSFHWFSFGTGFQNHNFNLFDSGVNSPDSQLVKQNYTIFKSSVEWNFYHWDYRSRWKDFAPSYYVLVGAEFNVSDNFDDLSKVELNDTRQYGDSTVQRSVSKKVTAYRGDYETQLIGARFYGDGYLFFSGNTAAIHGFFETRIQQHNLPVYNTSIGLLYSFKNAKEDKDKTKLNAELYFRLYDLSNSRNSDLETLERNELGIRLSIPIAFFNF